MKFYFARMHCRPGIITGRPESGPLYRYPNDKPWKFLLCLFFAITMALAGTIIAADARADFLDGGELEASPGHDETGGVGNREELDWWLRGNNFQANHAKIGDVKVGFDKFKFRMEYDEYRWLTIGAGYRGSGVWAQNEQNNYRDRYSNDNARIYVNGQIHRFIKFEFNTECFWCNNTAKGDDPKILFTVLDAVGKFEYNRYFNVWGGRMLVPTERGELSGPYFQATHDPFKTPFFPSDFSTNFGAGGAGRYGRDDGGTFWGSFEPGFLPGTLSYAGGVFRGLSSKNDLGPNQGDDVKWAGRVTYNFLNPENNPGYYTSSTYYGTAGDILAVAFGFAYQKNGAGSLASRSDFLGLVTDVLFEKVLPENLGVFTVNGEYKHFYADYDSRAFADPDCFCIFDGQSWTVTGLYLFPTKIGIGQFQPYGRYTSVQPDNSSNREEVEGGVNYIIDGFNARISAYYQYGDLFTKGLNYAPDAFGEKVNVFKLSFQIQI
ncbi:hypothetical protein SAMN05421690_100717 [Nitrosomonas sp. Nm51]|uniref:hypothetical protein n=1 Tax=Nitrosomonas sp. Nm51 TaxID=133720 RepID=UPI0008D70F36|nr:hypothetical protein [Nitrosomonas sp. Nm51]SER06095.1 hypothetical protein SAMN05421690_100717 [Nitrosomonas sp. Nm51]